MDANKPHRIIGRLLRLGVSGAARSSSDDPTAVGELETELALLREENAWLKVERHRAPDAGRVIERMRELAGPSQPTHATDGLHTSDGAQAMVECLAIRDGLLDACQEIQQAMQGIRHRLSGLSVDAQASAGDRPTSSPITSPSNGEVSRDTAVDPRATPNLSHNAA